MSSHSGARLQLMMRNVFRVYGLCISVLYGKVGAMRLVLGMSSNPPFFNMLGVLGRWWTATTGLCLA